MRPIMTAPLSRSGRVRRLDGGSRVSEPNCPGSGGQDPPQELAGALLAGRGEDLRGRALLEDPAVVRGSRPWWRPRGRRPSRGWPAPSWCRRSARSRMIVEHLADQLGVEGGGDLVEQQQRRVGGQRPGQRGPLLLAAGEPVGVLVGLVGQAEPARAARGPGPPPRPRAVPCTRRGASVSCPARSGAGTGCRPGRPSPSGCAPRARSTRGSVISSPLEPDRRRRRRPRAGSGSAAASTCREPEEPIRQTTSCGCDRRGRRRASTTWSPYDLRSVRDLAARRASSGRPPARARA